MHSSRMRTARLLAVSPSMHCAGGSAPGGCLLEEGLLSQHALDMPRSLCVQMVALETVRF